MNAASSTINGLSDESDTFSGASVNIQTQGSVPEDSDDFPKELEPNSSTIDGRDVETDSFSEESANMQTQGSVPEDSDNFAKEIEPNSSNIDGQDDESDSFSEELANIQTQGAVLEDSDSFSKELAGIFEHELTDTNNDPATKDVDVCEGDKIIVEMPITSTVKKPSVVESEKSRAFQRALAGFQLPASMKIKGRRPSSQMDITMETIIELDTEYEK